MSPEPLFGYPSAAHRDLFRILDAIRELPGFHRLCRCSKDFAWCTPWWVLCNGAWYCPWAPSLHRNRHAAPW